VQAEGFGVSNAKNVLESAKDRLGILDRLTKEKFKVQFESDIEAAKARLKSDASVLSEEQDELEDIRDQIAKCIILSPAEGVVVHNNTFSSRGGGAEFVVEEGALVRERQTIIKLPDPSKMQVKAAINEQNITLIAEGMAAKIKVSAVEGDMLARVKRVNKYAEPGSWFSSSVKEYATYIEILNPPKAIRTGMTAEVRIFVAQIANALQIPVHGIFEYKGHHFCLRQNGGAWDTVEIQIGATNDEMVTIDEGLVEGDVVALNPRKHLDIMVLPEVEEVTDREKLIEIGAKAGEPVKPVAESPPAAGGPGAGGPGGAAFNPQMIVDRVFAADTDGDGKLAGDELKALDERMRSRVSEYDTNGDGALEKSEVLQSIKKRMQQAGAGGGRGGN
jgi:HlyD family secretion protein